MGGVGGGPTSPNATYGGWTVHSPSPFFADGSNAANIAARQVAANKVAALEAAQTNAARAVAARQEAQDRTVVMRVSVVRDASGQKAKAYLAALKLGAMSRGRGGGGGTAPREVHKAMVVAMASDAITDTLQVKYAAHFPAAAGRAGRRDDARHASAFAASGGGRTIDNGTFAQHQRQVGPRVVGSYEVAPGSPAVEAATMLAHIIEAAGGAGGKEGEYCGTCNAFHAPAGPCALCDQCVKGTKQHMGHPGPHDTNDTCLKCVPGR